MLAALLYLGSGSGLLLCKIAVSRFKFGGEARLAKADAPWLVGAVLAGGIIAPVLLMSSLRITPAATASMLINFEGVATSLIAAVMFREAMGKRVWLAMAAITAASIILAWDRHGSWGFSIGALGILLACVLWGLDNNFVHHISAKDPVRIALIKSLAAGVFLLGMALALKIHLPAIRHIFLAAMIGFFCYGLSMVLFVSALRTLGAGRTVAYFGTSPFLGAFLSFLIFRVFPDMLFLIAAPVMAFGVMCLLLEKHEHTHIHVEMEHEHAHNHHDEHHQHEHETDFNGVRHKHYAIVHTHSHTPDIHHRHEH